MEKAALLKGFKKEEEENCLSGVQKVKYIML